MDRYTKMCKELTQLQEEWEPKVGDRVWGIGNKIMGFIIGISMMDKIIYITINNAESLYVVKGSTCIFIPSLEVFIEMLGKISWELKKVEVDVGKYSYEAWTWKMPKDGFWAGSPHKAILKLLAYERWGLTWSDEKETWE